nr:NUDIX hydrolase [Rhizobium jaguaris]
MARQVGAICFRRGKARSIEVLLITTRETQRWSIPKGWPIKGLKAHEVAEREAWEEAGVIGTVKKKPFGYYTYLKILGIDKVVPSMVQVHLLKVEKGFGEFPESGQRILEWLGPALARPIPPLLTRAAGVARNGLKAAETLARNPLLKAPDISALGS